MTEKRKKRKPSKLEMQIKLVECVPVGSRWWSPWLFEASHTVARIASDPPTGGVTEEVWNARKFEKRIRSWMKSKADEKAMLAQIFS
jgi:hypothetical protein